jgi:hypothetical protein
MPGLRLVVGLLALLLVFYSATYVDSRWLRDWEALAAGVE